MGDNLKENARTYLVDENSGLFLTWVLAQGLQDGQEVFRVDGPILGPVKEVEGLPEVLDVLVRQMFGHFR